MKHSRLFLFLGIALAGTGSYASEHPGNVLVEQNCQGCHDNSIYSRSDSIIQSWPELQARVEFCDGAANTHFSDEQINQVIDFLNDTYYKYPKP